MNNTIITAVGLKEIEKTLSNPKYSRFLEREEWYRLPFDFTLANYIDDFEKETKKADSVDAYACAVAVIKNVALYSGTYKRALNIETLTPHILSFVNPDTGDTSTLDDSIELIIMESPNGCVSFELFKRYPRDPRESGRPFVYAIFKTTDETTD